MKLQIAIYPYPEDYYEGFIQIFLMDLISHEKFYVIIFEKLWDDLTCKA